MAFVCPKCKEETLSTRSVEVKICLNPKCENVEWQNLTKLLRKMGITEESIDQINGIITANIV